MDHPFGATNPPDGRGPSVVFCVQRGDGSSDVYMADDTMRVRRSVIETREQGLLMYLATTLFRRRLEQRWERKKLRRASSRHGG